MFGISGIRDLQGCDSGFYPRGMETAGSCTERFVQGRDAGELYTPGLYRYGLLGVSVWGVGRALVLR